jgi:hypothetical protein
MASNQIILSGITADELLEMFRPIIQSELKKLKDEQPEKLLSPAEVCKLFQPPISKVTLTAWTEQGKLQDRRIGGRIFYKQSEILAALVTLKKYRK